MNNAQVTDSLWVANSASRECVLQYSYNAREHLVIYDTSYMLEAYILHQNQLWNENAHQ